MAVRESVGIASCWEVLPNMDPSGSSPLHSPSAGCTRRCPCACWCSSCRGWLAHDAAPIPPHPPASRPHRAPGGGGCGGTCRAVGRHRGPGRSRSSAAAASAPRWAGQRPRGSRAWRRRTLCRHLGPVTGLKASGRLLDGSERKREEHSPTPATLETSWARKDVQTQAFLWRGSRRAATDLWVEGCWPHSRRAASSWDRDKEAPPRSGASRAGTSRCPSWAKAFQGLISLKITSP